MLRINLAITNWLGNHFNFYIQPEVEYGLRVSGENGILSLSNANSANYNIMYA